MENINSKLLEAAKAGLAAIVNEYPPQCYADYPAIMQLCKAIQTAIGDKEFNLFWESIQ